MYLKYFYQQPTLALGDKLKEGTLNKTKESQHLGV